MRQQGFEDDAEAPAQPELRDTLLDREGYERERSRRVVGEEPLGMPATCPVR
jgi:hypothetical protein